MRYDDTVRWLFVLLAVLFGPHASVAIELSGASVGGPVGGGGGGPAPIRRITFDTASQTVCTPPNCEWDTGQIGLNNGPETSSIGILDADCDAVSGCGTARYPTAGLPPEATEVIAMEDNGTDSILCWDFVSAPVSSAFFTLRWISRMGTGTPVETIRLQNDTTIVARVWHEASTDDWIRLGIEGETQRLGNSGDTLDDVWYIASFFYEAGENRFSWWQGADTSGAALVESDELGTNVDIDRVCLTATLTGGHPYFYGDLCYMDPDNPGDVSGCISP